jgi:hypothetical protein
MKKELHLLGKEAKGTIVPFWIVKGIGILHNCYIIKFLKSVMIDYYDSGEVHEIET